VKTTKINISRGTTWRAEKENLDEIKKKNALLRSLVISLNLNFYSGLKILKY